MPETIYQKHRPSSSDDLYLKLKDGDAIKMRIYSEPAIVVFKEGQRPRYAWVVINHNNKKAQVFNAGISIYSQIADIAEDWGDPKDFDIMIRRKGAGQFDTEYSVTPVKTPTAPTKEQETEADKIDLINATKGKWLQDYESDGTLPAPVSNEPDTVPHEEMPTDIPDFPNDDR
jgi:hypothetical protein